MISKQLYPTTNTDLAAYLATIGVQPDPIEPFTRGKDPKSGKPQVTWLLNGLHPEGTATAALADAFRTGTAMEPPMNVEEFLAQIPENLRPVAIGIFHSFAACAIDTKRYFTKVTTSEEFGMITLTDGNETVIVVRGSQNYENLIRAGYVEKE